MIDFPRQFPDNPIGERGNPISEKTPYPYKVDAQFYMERDNRKLMLVIKTFAFKLYI